jgi:hypothetical protein
LRLKSKLTIAAAMLLVGACSQAPNEASAFTLYRSSVENAAVRIHVATFDADEDAIYNQENCQIAQELFQRHRGAAVKYWCEKGRFRESAA